MDSDSIRYVTLGTIFLAVGLGLLVWGIRRRVMEPHRPDKLDVRMIGAPLVLGLFLLALGSGCGR